MHSHSNRKRDHIDICLGPDIEHASSSGFDAFQFLHVALPEIDFEDIELQVNFLGHDISAPLFISGMTGGINDAVNINRSIHQLKIEHAIVRLGYLEAEQLASIYQCAFAYVFPSFNEGFGLPVLEAFNAGLPVICANNSALPEVAADAALYFDPNNTADLAACMQSMIEDAQLRQELIEKGKLRLSQFSWNKAALEIEAALALL